MKKLSTPDFVNLYSKLEKQEKKGHALKNPAALKPSSHHSRQHSHAAKLMLQASIEKYGFWGSILIDENDEIIQGHLRAEAAKELGFKFIPTTVLTGLNEKQKRFLKEMGRTS